MQIVLRDCLWCGHSIQTKRSHTKLHSTCHVPMHRLRQKLMPGAGPGPGAGAFFEFISIELSEGRHPNPKHVINNPINNNEESLDEIHE
jgi:hypothetical protein